MFQIDKYKDSFNREYELVRCKEWKICGKEKVFALVLTYGSDDYLHYCKSALDKQVDMIFEYCEKGDDLSEIANECLKKIPVNSWVFYVNPDEILFDLPEGYLGALTHFLEENKIYCGDARFRDFAYNYGTLFAHFDWGEGAGNYWTARRLFKWTGKEKFIHKIHFNISNNWDKNDTQQPNNEHTGEWNGTVAKLNDVILFHYGKCRGIEGQRGKSGRLVDGEAFARGSIATIPYTGRHPSVMNI
jgi:uncharacterized protein YuzB (UPF0349 family)